MQFQTPKPTTSKTIEVKTIDFTVPIMSLSEEAEEETIKTLKPNKSMQSSGFDRYFGVKR